MVTQLYTAPLKPYIPNPNGLSLSGNGLPSASNSLAAANSGGEDTFQQNNPNGLSVVQEQSQSGVISINSVVGDFQNTMSALGVPPEVASEVQPYLQVVANQAQKPQPMTGLIKQNLKISADTLDQFITQTLGQKSTVVREWVDALLMQPINYHSDTPIAVQDASNSNNTPIFNSSTAQVTDSHFAQYANVPDSAVIKSTLQSAKQAVQSGQLDDAVSQYQSALSQIGTQTPDLQGHVLYQLGQVFQKQGNSDDAMTVFQQANTVLANSSPSALQVKVLNALGNGYQAAGNLDQAATQYQSAFQMSQNLNDPALQVSTQIKLGQVQAQLGNTDMAQTNLNAALTQAQDVSPKLTYDALSALGSLARQTGQTRQSFTYYKQSWTVAQSQDNATAKSQSLQQIAALYLDINKPDKALVALQSALVQ